MHGKSRLLMWGAICLSVGKAETGEFKLTKVGNCAGCSV